MDLSYTIFLVLTTTTTTTHHHHKLFFGFRGVQTCQMDLGWVGSTQVGGQDFQVYAKAEIKLDYRGDIREYFNESKIV